MTKVIKMVKSDKEIILLKSGSSPRTQLKSFQIIFIPEDPKNGIAIIISQSPNMRRCDVAK